MIPVGYMFKKVVRRPDWLNVVDVDEIYSLSGCVSGNFTDYINYWKHNGYWLFDSPMVMEEVARDNNLSLTGMTLFYYEVFEQQFDESSKQWSSFEPEASFATNVAKPASARLQGYDVATFSVRTSPECSPLSCNGLAAKVAVNRHCLFDSFEQAKQSLESGQFDNSEPGPFRIFAVYTVGS
jgi:hypothetical protein